MSSEIYARPDLSKKVRYNRKVQEDKVEWEEVEVDIYENADAIRDDHTDFQSHEGGKWEIMTNKYYIPKTCSPSASMLVSIYLHVRYEPLRFVDVSCGLLDYVLLKKVPELSG